MNRSFDPENGFHVLVACVAIVAAGVVGLWLAIGLEHLVGLL